MQTTYPQAGYRPKTSRRSSVDFLVIYASVALLTAIALFAVWQFWHTDRVFSGVRVADVPVGGQTRAQAIVRLNEELTPYPVPPISLVYDNQQWLLSSNQIAPQVDLMAAINEAYLIGRQGSFLEKTADQIGAFVGRYNVDPPLTFDEGAVRQQISQIAAELRRPGRAGVQMGSVTLPSQPGLDVDVDATAAQVMSALSAHEVASIPIQTFAVQPPDAATTVNGSPATTAMREPITLREAQSGLSFALDAAVLSTIDPNGDASRINEGALRSLVETWAAQVDIPAQDARLRFNRATGQVEVISPSVIGRSLDVEATINGVKQALTTKITQIALPINAVAPAVDAGNVGALGIRELVASGTTYFRGSSLARIRNIEVAAEKFVGVVIAPGDVFSFNQIVQDVSAANGFEDSAIIWGDQTMVGVGGGVCQVSTTVFRAALNAGFPIVERYNHGYVVSWYGEPGMDATIYTPNVDFRFRNDTDAYLLVQPTVDSVNGVITFDFFGAKPDRQVTIGQPVITDVKEPGDPVYRIDESLAPGQRRQVEYAQRGMTVTVERTVTENGDTRVDKIVSEYQPWNAVFLVPPGTEIPATATPEVGD
ncbi:MAG: VanW family protein [Caldilineaceae bacterium]